MNRKELYILALITFMTVVVWIIFGISGARKISKVEDQTLKTIVPLTPTFDSDIINQLNRREAE
ncbi:hypothetical protein A3D05_05215 [Candidatus Gottesmanbacteria bacterium RIFCSPHIGHO2_02_FULL_40_24]|uniref:Uncharacterized protein n=1 Tax=Candidatus Gottesmanbacteria bacterium RIFCSPHIGHO2_01_FULL_40_15 TaxID=1798376 RepID=A0A1F5Z6N8_9BACT|nr:MAG: hypothetical protein A2777_01850 [Candidatus Gottesmanbacteria bacterium RIFCSPHIGHO2_01_FULL_40_15]OGG16431.1 MAG: hypothetical protein A3D05_05215 [Candidatus Gottesmanbacteria bacterium RIFCSPHIGHO2_02_FULL_40_24]OGG22713.1 MAG: hypothetical protein A3B48_02845 [Candidatus Gottesmanbacteria bacterium RIFCSPLOWO2_01_FULL_40_10]OGG25545.1 MAG: hypothetical protein A3E42_04365 [Candidatus Gottesmanbacteria bacterium RIFCSPHIGHO2_12_FULL_40_13]OGG32553.1 MAG: hypothetical protein A3I80_0